MRLAAIFVVITLLLAAAFMTVAQDGDRPPITPADLQTQQAQLPPFVQTLNAIPPPPPVATFMAGQTLTAQPHATIPAPVHTHAPPQPPVNDGPPVDAMPTQTPSPTMVFVAPTATPDFEAFWQESLTRFLSSITGE